MDKWGSKVGRVREKKKSVEKRTRDEKESEERRRTCAKMQVREKV